MADTVSIENFAAELAKSLQTYTVEVMESVKELGEQIAKDAVAELKQSSPKGVSKEYAKKWAVKAILVDRSEFKFVIHNKKHWQLTHLLENGHQLRQGGWSPPKVHIRPVEQSAIAKFGAGLEVAIKNAGR